MRELIKTTLADQVYAILRENIINQTIKSGEKLILKILQERFSVSSTPIREAINKLAHEGLVDQVTNIGAKVIRLSINDCREIYDYCSCLDAAALTLALRSGRTAEIISELSECIEAQEKSLQATNIDEFLGHSDHFHAIFFKYANNSRLFQAAMQIDGQFTLLSTLYQKLTLTKAVVLSEHKNIVAAIAANDSEKAAGLMISHFEHAKNYLLGNIGK